MTTQTIEGTDGKYYVITYTVSGSKVTVSSLSPLSVPVVTPISFSLKSPLSNDELVGSIAATNTPTSWAIASGDPNKYFAIYLQIDGSAHLRTAEAAGSALPPAGTYVLGVTAKNSAGTSAAANVTIVIASAANTTPANTTPANTTPANTTPANTTPANTTPANTTPANTVVSSGPFNNLNTWPSAANRPAYASNTNTLTWIGPVGGGPTTANDSQQSLVLKSSPAITTTADGQVIEGLFINTADYNQITVAHNNVVIRNCYLACSTGPKNTNGWANILVNQGTSNTIIEDCELNGNGPLQNVNNASGTFNILADPGGNFTVRRCNMYGYEQMVARCLQNVVIEDCYMHDVGGVDADMIELYDDNGVVHDVLIQHNTFNQPVFFAGYNSQINMSTNWNPSNFPSGTKGIYNVTVNNNRFIWAGQTGPHVICDDNRNYGISVTWSCTNNGMLSNMVAGFWDQNSTLSLNSGNFILTDESDTNITGALVNGTGAV